MKQGKFQETSPEFIQFKRQNITKWGGLSQLMQQIEKSISQFNVGYAYIDVLRMLQLADLDNERYSEEEIMSCVSNRT